MGKRYDSDLEKIVAFVAEMATKRIVVTRAFQKDIRQKARRDGTTVEVTIARLRPAIEEIIEKRTSTLPSKMPPLH